MFWQERLNPRIFHNDNLTVVNFTLHSCDGTSFQYFHTFFPTNNSVGNTRLFWNQWLFSVENKHLFVFLSRRLALNLLMIFKLFLQSASGPDFSVCSLILRKWSTLRATQKHAVSDSYCNFYGAAHFPYKSTCAQMQWHLHRAELMLKYPYVDLTVIS